jgi:hypothetical protein
MSLRPRHPRQERPSRGEGGAPRRPRPARKPWLPVIPPTPTTHQLCAVNPPSTETIFALNVREALDDLNVPINYYPYIERDPDDQMQLFLEYRTAEDANLVYNWLRRRVLGSPFLTYRWSLQGERLQLRISHPRVLDDLLHPDGAARPTDSANDEDDDDPPPSAPAAPTPAAPPHRVINPYAGPATRQALVNWNDPAPRQRFSPGTQAYMNGGAP